MQKPLSYYRIQNKSISWIWLHIKKLSEKSFLKRKFLDLKYKNINQGVIFKNTMKNFYMLSYAIENENIKKSQYFDQIMIFFDKYKRRKDFLYKKYNLKNIIKITRTLDFNEIRIMIYMRL